MLGSVDRTPEATSPLNYQTLLMSNSFDFDNPNPDLGYDEDLPEFDETEGALDEKPDVSEGGVVDDDPDEVLSGMEKAEIVEALDQEYGIKASEDADREVLANQLISRREQEVEEARSEESGEEEDAPPEDWYDGDEFEDEGEENPLTATDEDAEEEEISYQLRSALKAQDIEPGDIGIEWSLSKLAEVGSEITDHKMAVMMMRWKQGLIVDATPIEWGAGTMGKLETATGVNENTLRQAGRVVNFFNHSVSDFKKFLSEGDDGVKPWYAVVEAMQDDVPSEDKTEEENEEILNEAKKTADEAFTALEKLIGQAERGEIDEEEKREIKGLTKRAARVTKEWKDSSLFDNIEDAGGERIVRSEEYLDFIRDFPDPINGKPSDDPAHTRGFKGTAEKASDASAIPLTRLHHDQLDENGREWFENRHDVSIDRLVKNYMHRWDWGEWLDMDLPTPEDL